MIEQLNKFGSKCVPNRNLIATFVASLGLVLSPSALPAQSVSLAWNSTTNPAVTGYLVCSGTNGVNFNTQLDTGTNTAVTVTNITPGATNYFEVLAHDANYHLSPPSPSEFVFIPNQAAGTNSGSTNTGSTNEGATNAANTNAAFSLLVVGNGVLTPVSAVGQLQEGGRFTLTAIPARGSRFAGWSSNSVSVAASPKYTFMVESNLVVQANFVTGPVILIPGNYNGLFYVASNAAVESSGSIVASVDSAGTMSAKVSLGSRTHAFAVQFSASGAAIKTIERPGLSPITVQLNLDPTNGAMTGTVSDGIWTSDLIADAAVYSRTNPAPQAGKYTLVFPGSGNGSNQPAGNGFGSVTVNDLGGVTFIGTLGDGTPVTSTTTVSGEGQWPLYISLYGGKGSMVGWLSFTNDGIIDGQVGWFKQPQPSAKLYPGGFTNSPVALGSSYHFTNGLPVLGSADGVLSLINGSAQENMTERVGISPDAQDKDQGGVKLVFNNSTGLFKGSLRNPSTGQPMSVVGAVLQSQQIGAGYFLGTTGTGSVVLSPAQ